MGCGLTPPLFKLITSFEITYCALIVFQNASSFTASSIALVFLTKLNFESSIVELLFSNEKPVAAKMVFLKKILRESIYENKLIAHKAIKRINNHNSGH